MWRPALRYLAPLLNCYRKLLEPTMVTINLTLNDHESLPKFDQSSWDAIT
jgi:hypothetical protein